MDGDVCLGGKNVHHSGTSLSTERKCCLFAKRGNVPGFYAWLYVETKPIWSTPAYSAHPHLLQQLCICELSPLQWRHNERDGVLNHQPHECLFNHLFRRRSKKTSKLRVTGLCEGNSPVTGEFPAQRPGYAENVSIWWRHHASMVHVSELPPKASMANRGLLR